MKKHLFRSILCIIALSASFLQSCQDELGPDQPETSFGFTEDTLRIGFAEGDYTVKYQTSGLSGEVKYATDATWLHLAGEENGSLQIHADANSTSQERIGQISLRMNDSSSRLRIIQDPYVDFRTEITEVTETGVTYSIYPTDKEMGYISLIMTRENVESFASENEFFISEMDYYDMMAQYYGLQLNDYLARLLIYGDIENQQQILLNQDTEYYLVIYGMGNNGSRLTGLYKFPFTTTSTEMQEMSFDMSFDVKGSDVTVTVQPDSWSRNYIFNLIEHGYSVEDLTATLQQYVSEQVSYITANQGISVAEAVDMISCKGDFTETYQLNANTVYDGLAIAVNQYGSLCSELTVKEFTTGNVEMSDNTISVEVEEINSRNAFIDISVTNNDQYVLGVDLASSYEGLTDAQILEKLTGSGYNLSSLCRRGAFNGEIRGLSPETPYIIFAFGYYGGVATTDITTARFTTTEAITADVSIECLIDEYYDGSELAAMDDDFNTYIGYAVIPIRVEEHGDISTYYYQFSSGDYTDPAKWSDNDAINSLLQYGVSAPRVFALPFESYFTLFSFAVDQEGNFGPLTRTLYRFDRSGVSPAEEFDPSVIQYSSPLMQSMERKESPSITLNNCLKF